MTTIQRLFLILLPVLLLAACGKKGGAPATWKAPQQTAPADALFAYIAPGESGIDFQNTIQETHELNITTDSYLYNGGGVGVIDVNNDGLQDLFFSSTMGACKLYLNEGNFKFKDISAQAGVESTAGQKTGVSVVDINADGWQDIYICRTAEKAGENRRNLLYINNKNNTFTESAKAYGLDDASPSNHANFFDVDNDGDLDCYVINHPVDFTTVASARVREVNGKMERITTPNQDFESSRLYRNNGNNTFTDITKEAGIFNRGFSLSVTVHDFNNDGFLDLFIGNDYIDPDFLYINNPAKPGTFTDQYSNFFRHTTQHTMGADFGDVNNDGRPDLMALDMLAKPFQRRKELMTTMQVDRVNTLTKYGYGQQQMRNVLQLNNGNGTYSDIACIAGVFQTDWSWAPVIQDFDNDGWRDIFVANGYMRDASNLDYINFTVDSVLKHGGITPKTFPDINDYLNMIPSTPLQNFCFRNRGDLTFEDVSTSWGLVELGYSNGSVSTDLDNDGDLDLVINKIQGPAGLYKNRAVDNGKSGGWIQFKLQGDGQNPQALGARARMYAGDKVWYDELTPTRGFFSSTELLFHFGLGGTTSIDRVEIEFPGNKLVSISQPQTNKRHTVNIADAKPGKLTPLPTPAAVMKPGPAVEFAHREDDIEDFNSERLLPWRLSKPGPCIAVGDVNGDGLDDFYVGNSVNAPGAVFIQSGSGYKTTSFQTFNADAGMEDAGCVFLDADGDKDLDLFVASGGNSFPAGNPAYQARLYTNDGKGNFSRNAAAIPNITQSCFAVTAADYDGDGDTDILLGGWYNPGTYPTPPNSFVLQNNGGTFKDVTDQVAPEFRKAGLVRSILFADLDGDKKQEMLVTGEWMPIQVYAWNNGKMEPATSRFGLDNTEGFWRSIAAGDIDGDGDIDLVAGNLGLNTRYEASPEAPLRMFAKDFDGNRSMDPIMTMVDENGKDNPLATREVMLKQLPSLRKKYVRTISYARATLEDMFEEKDLKAALQLHCNYLASAVFYNENGKFVMQKLPNEAQIAPVNAIVLTDWQNDGDLDIVLAGNDYGQQYETGRIDSGNGLVLQNNGNRQFQSLSPLVSGFWATKEVRDVKIINNTGGGKTVLVANNNDRLQTFQFK